MRDVQKWQPARFVNNPAHLPLELEQIENCKRANGSLVRVMALPEWFVAECPDCGNAFVLMHPEDYSRLIRQRNLWVFNGGRWSKGPGKESDVPLLFCGSLIITD